MINYIIIKTSSIPLNYGVGTYINNITNYLSCKPNIIIHEIWLHDNIKEFTFSTPKVRTRCYQFPSPLSKYSVASSVENQKIYIHRVIDILSNYIQYRYNSVLHINYSGLSFIAEIFRKRYNNLRVISTIHSIDWKFSYSSNRDKFFECYDKRNRKLKYSYYENNTIEISHMNIFVTRNGCNEFLDIYKSLDKERCQVIYNSLPIRHNSFPSKIDKLQAKNKLGFGDDFLILFVGRLSEEKGVMTLIKAFKRVSKKTDNVKLLIAGSGDFNECHQLAFGLWDKIIFTGHVEGEKLELIYKAADLGVMPSIFEQCSYVAIEMILQNVPLIVSDIDGLSEIFQHEVTSIKIPIAKKYRYELAIDEDLLTEWMYYLIENGSYRNLLITNGKDYYMDYLNNEKNITKFYELILQLFN